MREVEEAGLFWRWGRLMYRLRWPVLAVWAVLFIALGLFAHKAPELMKDNGFTPRGSESDAGMNLLQEQLGFPASMITVVYHSDRLDLTKQAEIDRIMNSLEPIRKLPYVTDVRLNTAKRNPVPGGEHVQSVNISISDRTDEALEHFPELRSRISAPDGMKLEVTGGTPILYDMQVASKHDIAKAEMIGLPIALIVLLAVFGTLPGAVLPLIVGAMSVSVTLGITYFIARHVSLSNFLPNMVTMLGLAVGIDYALFMVSRFREEMKRRDGPEAAVAMTCQTAGRSIFFSGIAVLIGLLGMLFINLTFFRSLCLGGLLVVFISVVVANTLLPALLGLFGRRINSLRVPLPRPMKGSGSSRLWRAVAYSVMKRPVLLVILIMAALICLMLPIGGMKLAIPQAGVLPPSYESRYGSDLLDQTYDAREAMPIQVYVHMAEEVWQAGSIRKLADLSQQIARQKGVKDVRSFLSAPGFAGKTPEQLAAAFALNQALRSPIEEQMLAKDHAAVLMVIPEYAPDDSRTDAVVKALRGIRMDGLDTRVTGSEAVRVDIMDRINSRIPAVVGFVMVITYVVLLIAFRSVLLPLKAVLMNILSLGASLGVVVTVFQKGVFAGALHITSIGYVSATLPVIIFCVVFGISMDYEVFLISRIAEEYEATGDNEASTVEGLVKTGSLITSAAFILVVVVGSFIFTDIEIIKALGLGLGLAVLIDATVVRVVLVPALMKLLGRANWWAPRWLKPGTKVSYNKG